MRDAEFTYRHRPSFGKHRQGKTPLDRIMEPVSGAIVIFVSLAITIVVILLMWLTAIHSILRGIQRRDLPTASSVHRMSYDESID